MECDNCGHDGLDLTTSERQLAGLPSIKLLNLKTLRCPQCGFETKKLERLRELERLVAGMLVSKRGRLSPEEFRWLRKRVGLKGEAMARAFGVTASSVSRWERPRIEPPSAPWTFRPRAQ